MYEKFIYKWMNINACLGRERDGGGGGGGDINWAILAILRNIIDRCICSNAMIIKI